MINNIGTGEGIVVARWNKSMKLANAEIYLQIAPSQQDITKHCYSRIVL